MSAKFTVIKPELLKYKVFRNSFFNAASEMAEDVKREFEDSTSKWKDKPAFKSSVKASSDNIEINVGTENLIFKFVDEGTAPHIIKPVRAKVLHWVDPESGGDRFATLVHHPGYAGSKITEHISAIFSELMPDYFEQALYKTVSEL